MKEFREHLKNNKKTLYKIFVDEYYLFSNTQQHFEAFGNLLTVAFVIVISSFLVVIGNVWMGLLFCFYVIIEPCVSRANDRTVFIWKSCDLQIKKLWGWKRLREFGNWLYYPRKLDKSHWNRLFATQKKVFKMNLLITSCHDKNCSIIIIMFF